MNTFGDHSFKLLIFVNPWKWTLSFKHMKPFYKKAVLILKVVRLGLPKLNYGFFLPDQLTQMNGCTV